MLKRRTSRERALQLLYAIDINSDVDAMSDEEFIAEATRQLEKFEQAAGQMSREMAYLLVRGVHQHLSTIDKYMETASDNWSVKRLSVIDRNILRIAVYEMAFVTDIPPRVAINEAIEIAKLYGSENSPKFINGILDRIYRILKSNSLSDPESRGKMIE